MRLIFSFLFCFAFLFLMDQLHLNNFLLRISQLKLLSIPSPERIHLFLSQILFSGDMINW